MLLGILKGTDDGASTRCLLEMREMLGRGGGGGDG